MSRTARTTAAPVPMGFRFDSEKSISENARLAWDTKRQITRPQAEQNARRTLRGIFGKDVLADEAIVFHYNETVTFERPLLELDGELLAWFGERSEFGLLEFCSDCGKAPTFRTFNSLAGYGQVLTERDEAEAHVCKLCKSVSMLKEAKAA